MSLQTDRIFGIKDNQGLSSVTAQNELERGFQDQFSTLDPGVLLNLNVATKPVIWSDKLLDSIVMYAPFFNFSQDENVQLMRILHKHMVSGTTSDYISYVILHFIMTSPFPFDINNKELFGIELKREMEHGPSEMVHQYPVDKQTLLSEPMMEESDCLAATTMEMTNNKGRHSKVNIDDKAFMKWYMNKDFYKTAQMYFCLYCTVLFRASVKKPETLTKHLSVYMNDKINEFTVAKMIRSFPTTREGFVKETAHLLSNEKDLSCGILKFFIKKYEATMAVNRGSKYIAFYTYAVNQQFYAHGFHLLHQYVAVYKSTRLTPHQLLEKLSSVDNPIILEQLDNLISGLKLVDFMNSTHGHDIRGEKQFFTYWPMSRFFEGRCFMELSIMKNPELMCFLIGMLPKKDHGALETQALINSKVEKNNWKDMGHYYRTEVWKLGDPDAAQFAQDNRNEDNEIEDLQALMREIQSEPIESAQTATEDQDMEP